MTGEQAAKYQATTAQINMVGAGLVPSKTKCFGCGKHNTTATGKATKAGFICHSCHSPRAVS